MQAWAGVKFLLASLRGCWVEVEVVAVEKNEASIEQADNVFIGLFKLHMYNKKHYIN
ncbi:6522_t:CDS:2 [Dentiscutata erythropus]|uniref:6522_t:CDS:1 n=1 Tax=Dentiscutata erythropus TaxID=1348616 RepID=A0A9N9F8V3_9GLOM|nr:6522_t:CDS:2 [Dentiscutata erythropus]